ncbi:cytochrome b/b6 domain-containing protein [Nocardioides caldifontis]|uniref:cytochrome b/b6 domain-containing protein n=1 Tax=Nocardioides caldifontis TaxID=2588938 RepID=UPI0011E05FC1|nr:cytochrome b/b6 domain-containing protein [Nocardioides caldifontis]
MPLRNGEHGYGAVTKLLHWLTVALLLAQVAVGLTMDPHAHETAADAAADRADARADAFEERGEDRAERQGDEAEERFEAEVERREERADRLGDGGDHRDVAEALLSGDGWSDGLQGLEVHLVLGSLLLLVGVTRLVWRRTTPLPPWAEHLDERERQLEGWLEKVMLALLLVVPLTGLLLVVVDDDLLVLHVAAQLLLLSVVVIHVGLVLRHTVVRRHRHLSRMV